MTIQRCLTSILLASLPAVAAAEEIPRLPGTAPLTWQGDLADRMMDGLHVFIERKIEQSAGQRPRYWKRGCSAPAAHEHSIQPNRQRFPFDPAARQQRQVRELEGQVQRLVRAADRTREPFFPLDSYQDPQSLDAFEVAGTVSGKEGKLTARPASVP
jgi:hypothetical protein